MAIITTRVVIHELVKEQHKPFEKAIKKSVVLPANNGVVLTLLEGVTSLYGRRNNSAHYGTFLEGAKAGFFPPAFNNYFEQTPPSDESFIKLSHVAIDELERATIDATAASGGYIMAADYESEQGRFFLIAMLKTKAGIRLSESLIPETTEELDLNSLHQAARINFERFRQYVTAKPEDKSDINYLSFVSPSTNKSTAGYFIKALGCSRGTASAKATDLVISETSAFFKTKPELTQHRIKFKQELTSYLSECAQAGRSATLSKVEKIARNYFPEDDHQKADEWAEELYARLNGEKNAVPNEFPVSLTVLKKHTFIKYKADKWDINFEVNALGITPDAEIQYDKQGAKLTIRHLPAEMREKIEEALRDLKVES